MCLTDIGVFAQELVKALNCPAVSAISINRRAGHPIGAVRHFTANGVGWLEMIKIKSLEAIELRVMPVAEPSTKTLSVALTF